MASVVMAQEATEAVSDCRFKMEASAETQNQATVEELYAQMVQGMEGMPSSFADFLVTDVYAAQYAFSDMFYTSGPHLSSFNSLDKLTLGANGEYRPLFEAIYEHVLNLIPSCYMDQDAVEHFTLAYVYVRKIVYEFNASRFVPGDTAAELSKFFAEKEAAMGEQSILKRLGCFMDENPSIRSDIFVFMSALENNFYGIGRKSGKFVIEF